MRTMRMVVTRVTSALLTLLLVSVLIFLAIHLIPGSYEDIILGPYRTPEARERVTRQYALGEPLPLQYLSWLRATVQGDLGTSLVTREPVADEFLRRAPATIQLTLMSSLLAVGIGIPLGFATALRRKGSKGEASARLAGAVALSVPDFVIGSLLIYLFSRWSLGLTVGGYVPFLDDPATNIRAMVLPAVTLGVFGIALIMRTTRDAVLNVLAEPYVTAAVARGETPGSIVSHHLLRNASIPVLTVATTYVAYLLGGAVIVESLYSIPGIGIYVINAIHNRDYAIVQAGVLIAATVFILVNMVSDVLYGVLDPRVASHPGTR